MLTLWLMTAFANPENFVGTWEFAGGDAERKLVVDTVESGAQRFNFAIRPIARSKLNTACALDETVTITHTDGRVLMSYTGSNERKRGGPSDGTKIEVGGSKVSWTFTDDTLTVDGANEDGGKLSIYKLVNPNTLKATHTVSSTRMGDPPLKYTLTYRRK